MEIKDFGEKIGGAKKDLWKKRGLDISDLLEMNDAEKESFIKKDNVWQKPDYQALVDSGIPVNVVFFMKKVRDATPVKPVYAYSDKTPELVSAKQEGYISFVRDLRDAVMNLKTETEVLNFYENYLAKKYITREPGKYYVTVSPEAYGCINNKLLNASRLSNFRQIEREIKKKQFCYSDKEKLQAAEKEFADDYDIFLFEKEKVTFQDDYAGRLQVAVDLGYGRMFFYPKGEDANISSWEEGKYFVIKRGAVVAKNLASRDDAEDVVKQLFEASLNKSKELNTPTNAKRKTRFVPKQLQHIKREGVNYRSGNHATGEKYLDVFEFKGGEFGNWMSENDRRASLDYGYDALLDMCKALNISPEDVSLGGRLSIAFGARGSGSALAHYEPLREVINLTKMRGAGSLAHEWAHAFDDIYGKELGLNGFMTEQTHKPDVPSAVKILVDSMKYKSVLDNDVLERQKAGVDHYAEQLKMAVVRLFPRNSMSEAEIEKVSQLAESLISNAKTCGDTFVEAVETGNGNKDIDALSKFKKQITGREIPKAQRIEFAHYQNNLRYKLEQIGKPQRVKTDFYENSIKFDKLHSKTDHGYWQSTIEMFARAFACYVHDKLEGRSDYLVGHSECAVSYSINEKTGETEIVKAIPDGAERETINRCFDNLIEAFKERGLLHDYEPIYEQAERKPSLMDVISSAEKQTAIVKETKAGQLQFDFGF